MNTSATPRPPLNGSLVHSTRFCQRLLGSGRQGSGEPVGQDRAFEIVKPAVLHREIELGIVDAAARSGRIGRHDEQPPVDLLPPIHPGGILLADEAALGKADAVQFGGVAFEPEQVSKLGASFGDGEAEAVLEPAFCRLISWRQPPPAKSF